MKYSLFIFMILLSVTASAAKQDDSDKVIAHESSTYQKIAKEHKSAALDDKQLANAKMQGDCLVGLKELNFKRKDQFDPVAEWTNYRSISLLEQYSPCEVLVMLEVAKQKLEESR